MTKALLIAALLSTASLTALAAPASVKKTPVAKLTATLMSGHVEALKQNINLSSDETGAWTVEVVKDCEAYPCAPADFTTRTKVKVVSVMDARAGDGPLRLSSQTAWS